MPNETFDVFGTYLSNVRGRTAIENVLEKTKTGPRSIVDLARELDFPLEDIVSAVGKAFERGMVSLEKHDEQTIVKRIV